MKLRVLSAAMVVLFIPSIIVADCLENPRTCDNLQICTYAAKPSSYGYRWDTAWWPKHVQEAKRRGLTCKVSPPKPRYKKIQSIYDAFNNHTPNTHFFACLSLGTSGFDTVSAT